MSEKTLKEMDIAELLKELVVKACSSPTQELEIEGEIHEEILYRFANLEAKLELAKGSE